MRPIIRFVGFLSASIVGACNATPVEPTRSTPAPIEHPLAISVTATPGFYQTFSTTKFQTGSAVSTVLEPGGMTKWVGANGVFAIDDIGAASGIMNAGVPFTPYAGGIAGA